MIFNKRPISQSQNTVDEYPTMHHFVWCIVGHGTGALWDLLNRSTTTHLLSIERADWPKLHNMFKAHDANVWQREFPVDFRLKYLP